jgi:transcriptional regulator with XRE-family HTH domain
MRSPNKKTTAIVLAGAVGLSTVAYGIGTQAGDGSSAAAARQNAGAQRGFTPPGLADLAKELGVEADALHDALRDYHKQEHAEMRSAFAAALAEALGKPAEEVQAALESLESERKARFAARLAQALGVDADDLTKALEELKDERPAPGDFPAELAGKLGLEADDVEAALMDVRPFKGHRHREHHPAAALRQLAAELDVTRAELRKALREVRAGVDLDRQDRRADLVKFLAERFDLGEAEVDDALPQFDGRGPDRPHGPGGPRGPGGFGPGPGGPPPGTP